VADERRIRRRDETAYGRDPRSVPQPPTGMPADPAEQLDPFGGSVIDSGPLWARRHRRQWRETDWLDPAPYVGEPDEAPVQPSALRARATAARRHFLPLPIENIDRHLGAGEEVLHDDRPALAWFLVRKVAWLLALAVVVAAMLVSLLEGWGWAAGFFAVVAVVIVVVLFVMRLDDRYTAYVITNARMIRMSGVLRNDVESIPWVRVTDVHFEQSFVERLFGYATLHIQSANEHTGLRRMSGIDDFESFTHHLTDMIVAKQGATTPLGRRSDYAIMPANRGLIAFRRKQREQRVRSALVVEDATPNAGGPAVVIRAADAAPGPGTTQPGTTGPGATAAGATAPGDLGRDDDTVAGPPVPGATSRPAPAPTRPTVPRVRIAEPEPEPDPGQGPVTTARMAIPGRLRRKRPDGGTPAPDPALPQDLSDMARVARSEMEADRRRQDDLLGRTGPDTGSGGEAGRDEEPGRDAPGPRD